MMDGDNNGSIQFDEFFQTLIDSVGPDGFYMVTDGVKKEQRPMTVLTVNDIVNHLKIELKNQKIGLTA